MAKTNKTLPSQFTPLAGLRQKYAASEQALTRHVLSEWKPILREKPKPADLHPIAQYLRDHPYLIGAHFGPYLYLIVKHWLGNTKAPKLANVGKNTARLVDAIMSAERISANAASHKVADWLAKDVDTVKRYHRRYGKVKRKISH